MSAPYLALSVPSLNEWRDGQTLEVVQGDSLDVRGLFSPITELTISKEPEPGACALEGSHATFDIPGEYRINVKLMNGFNRTAIVVCFEPRWLEVISLDA